MRDVLKWIVFGGVFLLPFIPLLVTGNLFFSYITGKGFAFRIIVEIVFAAWVLLVLYDKSYRPRFSWICASFSAFVVVIFFADLFGETPGKSFWSNFERMEGWVTLIQLLLYFIVAGSVVTTEKLWSRFFNTSLAAASLVSLYALSQLVGLVGIAQGGVRIDATLGNAIYMAAYMLFHVFIALFLLVRSERGGIRLLYGALALVFAFLLVLTATRGAIIGLVGGILVASLYGAFASRGNRAARNIALLGVAAVLLASGVFYAVRNTAYIQQHPIWSRIASISLSAGETRFTIWDIALEGAKERPLLGWGQSNFDYVFDAHYRPSLYAQESWFDRVHNIILDWLIAGGILGLAAYLALWFSTLYALLARGRERFSLAERSILLGLLVGYGLHNLFVFDNLISYFFFVTILALVHTRVATVIPRVLAFHIDKTVVTQVVAPAIAVVLCLSLYYVNVPGIAAAGDLIDALTVVDTAARRPGMPADEYNALLMRGLDEFTQAISRNSFAAQEIREQLALTAQRVFLDERATDETQRAYVERAEVELRIQVTEQPKAARMHVFLATLYRAIGEDDKALAELAVTETLTPNKQSVLFDIGSAYLNKKEYGKATEVFQRAFMLAPEYDEARAYSIVAALYAGDDALVAELSAPPHDALFREHDAILRAYYALKKYDMVLELLSSRIEKAPGNVQLRISKAAVQHESGDTAGAVETLKQAAKDFPEFKTQAEQFIAELRK